MKKNLSYLLTGIVSLAVTAGVWISSSEIVSAVLFGVGSLLALLLLVVDEQKLANLYADQGVTGKVVITRSALFLIALIPLGLFVTTSSGSSLGKGLVMALLLGVWFEMVLARTNLEFFNARFLSQLKTPLGQQGVMAVLASIGFFWLFLLVTTVIV